MSARVRCCLLLALTGAGCLGQANPGYDPPADRIYFPAGLALDPRVASSEAECAAQACDDVSESCVAGRCRKPARWLFVTDANSDLRFNASALLAVDLDAFHAARTDLERIAEPGGETSAATPCRRLAIKPQVIECDEKHFIDAAATVDMGNFASVIAGWDLDPDDDRAMLLVPVRGDPSVVWLDIEGGLAGGDDLRIECGQGEDPDERDPRLCGDEHRLTHLRNDDSLARIGAEPINVLVNADRALAYVTHAVAEELTLIDLRGLDGNGSPVVTHGPHLMSPISSLGLLPGAVGVAERPCDPAFAPNASLGCERPLVYASLRYDRFMVSASVLELDPDLGSGAQGPGQGLTCVGPDELGEPGGVVCEPQFSLESRFFAGGISPSEVSGAPQLGELAFSADGEQMFAVQTNPGAVLRIDSSLDNFGNPRDIPAGTVEVCPRATAMAMYRDGQDDYALVSCYRSGAVFVVDLATLSVVANIQPGTGPHQMLADLPRELLYVANTLEATVSVIDMSRHSPARFSEVARIGLQEAFSGD